MVQFTIAYVALGIGLLFLLGGLLVLLRPPAPTALSDNQRVAILGGIGGMFIFLFLIFLRLR